MLAWSITDLNAAAGVMVTASHNPPADNGYKVYLGDGPQIVPPHDSGISAEIARVDAPDVVLADADDPLIEHLGDDVLDRYLASIPAVRRRPEVAGVPVAYTPMHGVGGDVVTAAFERAGFAGRSSSTSSTRPTPPSRPCRSRTRRSRGRWTC